MLILGITSRLIIILTTVVVAAGCLYSIRYLSLLKQRLSKSIILVPLYKSKAALIIGSLIILALIIIAVINMIIHPDMIYLLINIAVMLVFILALLVTLITQRFAVIDTGIIAPYRYIDWIQFSDYEIEDNTVFFTGDKYGFSSLSSTTMRLSVNSSDINKLELILSRNKGNK